MKSRIPLESLFNIRAFSSDSTSLSFLSSATKSESKTETNAHDHDHDHVNESADSHNPNPNPHYNDITTVLIPLPTLNSTQQEKVESFLQTLLWESRIPAPEDGSGADGPEILRTKGYFETTEGSEYVVQGVTDIFEIKEVAEHQRQRKDQEKVDGKLVFIGRGVAQDLRASFERFVGL